MKTLDHLLSLISYRLGFNKSEYPLKDKFINYYNGYKYHNKLSERSRTGYFHFALYKKDRNRIFCKAWFGITKNIGYYWIKNEIETYKYLSKFSFKSFTIPKYYGFYEAKGKVLLFIEYIHVRKKKNLNYSNRISILENIILEFQKIKVNKESKIVLLNSWLIIILSVCLILYSCISSKKFRSYFFKYHNIFLNGFIHIHKSKDYCFVHRDLMKNIFHKNNINIVSDFQVSAFSLPFVEFANLSFATYGNSKMYNLLIKTRMFSQIYKSNNLDQYKTLCIMSGLYDLMFIHNKNRKYTEKFIYDTLIL